MGKVNLLYQMTDNYTVQMNYYYGYECKQFQVNMLWKSTVYVLTVRISVPVYYRLAVNLSHPYGIHIHDGPGFLSRNLNQGSSMILLSTFQTFIVIYTLIVRNKTYGINYGSVVVRGIDILVYSHQMKTVPPCNPQLISMRNMIKPAGNKHCVYILRANAGYVNLSITKMSYNGPNFNKTSPMHEGHNVPEDQCLQGGLAYEKYRTSSQLELHYICNNYTDKYSNAEKSHHKSFMDVISSSGTMLLVLYSYEYYSDVYIDAKITSSVCKGVHYYGGM